MYALYSLLLFAALIGVFPVYWMKLRLGRKERLHLRERLGLRVPARPSDRPLVWIHAVSVGEVLSLQSLVREIKARHPEWLIGLSVLTETGFRMAREKIPAADRIYYVPLDFAGPVRRVLRSLRPGLLVLAESEFWPRLLREARRSGIPVLLVNGRISARTAKRLRRLRPIVQAAFRAITRFLVQTDRDRERLIRAGLPAERIAVAGNLKCEVSLPEFTPDDIARRRGELGAGAGRLWIAGSIHRGEEGPLLDAFRAARRKRPDLRLVLAPRHPEKFAGLEKEAVAAGLVMARRTSLRPGEGWDVLILDTIGELARFYALADAAFIGGSLIAWGGQNLLEPAFYAKPIYFGPHMDNFAALAEAFTAGGAARVVRARPELEAMFLEGAEDERAGMGRRAKAVLESLQGAMPRTLAAIEELMIHEHHRP